MLTLSRKLGQKIVIGDDITLVVRSIHAGAVEIGVEAPRGTRVDRLEVRERIERERAEGGAA